MSHRVLDSNFSLNFIEELFSKTDSFLKGQNLNKFQGKLVASVFFEPSTRTRTSFEIASKRIGCDFVHLNVDSSTSLYKKHNRV